MPGWKGTINGRKVIVSASGPLFQSINLPSGTDKIVFQYEPNGLTASVICMVAGVIVILSSYCIVPFIHIKKDGPRGK